MSEAPQVVVLFRSPGRVRLVAVSVREGDRIRSELFRGRNMTKLIDRCVGWIGPVSGRLVVNNKHLGMLLSAATGAKASQVAHADYSSKVVRATYKELHIGLLGLATDAASAGRSLRVKPRSVTHVFTDGSFDPDTGCGGWAAVGVDGTLLASAGLCASSVHAELNALLLAYEHADIPDDGRLIVHTDCQAIVAAISRWRRRGHRAGWLPDGDGFADVFDDRRLSVQWVKGHAGNHGNVVADQLAGLARQHAITVAA